MPPLISIVLTTYNHRRYLREAVQSLLDQTVSSFEMHIVDDGSTDGTQEALKGIEDSRIHYHYLGHRGVSAAANHGLSKAQGKYIAMMSGDDVAEPNRFFVQQRALETFDYDLVFCRPNLISSTGEALPDSHYEPFYLPGTHNESIYLRELFYAGNFFFAPSLFAKKEAVLDIYPFQYASLQLQDFDFWIRAAKKYKLHILNERLMKYRLREDQNLSHDKNRSRIELEKIFIYETFFDGVDYTALRKNFPEYVELGSSHNPDALQIDIDFIYLSHRGFPVQMLGLKRLFSHYQNEKTRNILIEERGFSETRYFELFEPLISRNIHEVSFLFKKFDPQSLKENP